MRTIWWKNRNLPQISYFFNIFSNWRAKKLFSHGFFVSAQNYKICCELNNIRCLRVSNTISFFLLNILGCQRRIFIYVLAIVYQRFILWHRNIDVFVEQLYKRNAQLVPFNFAIIVQFTVYIQYFYIFVYYVLGLSFYLLNFDLL